MLLWHVDPSYAFPPAPILSSCVPAPSPISSARLQALPPRPSQEPGCWCRKKDKWRKQWKNNEKKHMDNTWKKKRSRIASLADLRLRDLGVLERCLVAAAVGRDGADGATGSSTGNHANSSLTMLTSLKGQLSAINSKYCVQDNWNHMKGIEKEMQRKYFRKETIFVSRNNHLGFWMFWWWRWRGRRR